jgi:formate dehydrogenase beta subunit
MNAVQEIKWWKAARPKDMGQFGETVCIHIDCNKIEVPAGASVLNAATNAGIYIPALCAHPDLPPAMQRGAGGAGCNLCMIELEGEPGMRKACSTTVADGMRVTTKSEKIFKSRQESLAKTLGPHPHVCLTCPQRDGCSAAPPVPSAIRRRRAAATSSRPASCARSPISSASPAPRRATSRPACR